ncbi:hypothetical protein E1956_45475 (plasmid) [Paraburkholderia pallida]|uniref:Uncharacterized protein n=2 Tax=Paraburkholderia pallida TaxID=2547399 RepID=A0A4V1B0Y1_9BURK|nr:hypothetical protein E1956_45475 [Paraburkholderia pallida]
MDRAKTLRTGDPKLALEVAWFVPAKYGKLSTIEAALHGQFAERIAFHDEGTSEWFFGEAKWASEFIENLLEEWSRHPISDVFANAENRVCRAYEADLESLYGPPVRLDPESGMPW